MIPWLRRTRGVYVGTQYVVSHSLWAGFAGSSARPRRMTVQQRTQASLPFAPVSRRQEPPRLGFRQSALTLYTLPDRPLARGIRASPAFSHHAIVPLPFRVKVRCWINDITPVVPSSDGNVSCASQGAPPCARLSPAPWWVVAPTTTMSIPSPWPSRAVGDPAFPRR